MESLKKLGGHQNLSHKSRVELETVKDTEVIFVDGEPLAFLRKGELVPVLVNDAAVNSLPKIVVDMGAVPHVVGGADIMAPGIRSIQGSFLLGQLIVVVDEKHGKHLAIGKGLLDSDEEGEGGGKLALRRRPNLGSCEGVRQSSLSTDLTVLLEFCQGNV